MTIDDRLTRAGQQFRDANPEPAPVRLDPQSTLSSRPRSPRRQRRTLGIAVAVCAVVALTVGVVAWIGSSGGSPHRIAATPAELARGPWQLTTATGDAGGIALPATPAHPFDLTFDLGAGHVNVSDGCNSLGSTVGVGDSQLTFGQTATTLVGCPDDGADLRAAISHVFSEGTSTWTLSGDTLTISRDATSLTYTRTTQPSALAGTAWLLVSADAGSGPIPLPAAPRPRPELVFQDSPSGVTVDDGCNTLGGTYRVDGSQLVFGQVSTTDVYCGDTLALQHAIDRLIIGGSADWTVSGDLLTVSHDGTSLTYTRAAPAATLWGHPWVLVTVDTETLPLLRPVIHYTLTVTRDATAGQQLRVDDDCNLTTVPVSITTGSIMANGDPLTTAVECTRAVDPAVTAAGHVVSATSIAWAITGDQLTLTAGGTTLTFDSA